jgi:hypothetical protein
MNEISELTLKLIIISIPGAIALLVYQKLTISTQKKNSFDFVLHTIVFGSITYLICELVFDYVFNYQGFRDFWLTLKSKEIPFKIVAIASGVSLVVGYNAAYIDNNKWLNRLAQKIGISHKYGDENLFTYFLNREDIQEVFIHDIANNLTYNGTVRHFSETADFKEVVLENVNVYAYDAPQNGIAYSLKSIYLARPKDSLTIEVPFIKES